MTFPSQANLSENATAAPSQKICLRPSDVSLFDSPKYLAIGHHTTLTLESGCNSKW